MFYRKKFLAKKIRTNLPETCAQTPCAQTLRTNPAHKLRTQHKAHAQAPHAQGVRTSNPHKPAQTAQAPHKPAQTAQTKRTERFFSIRNCISNFK